MQLILRIGLSISYGIIVEALFTGILRIGLSISYGIIVEALFTGTQLKMIFYH